MLFTSLHRRPGIDRESRLARSYDAFQQLMKVLESKPIPPYLVNSINKEIEALNSFPGNLRDLAIEIRKTEKRILKSLGKELKLVARNHYRNAWTVAGMTVFGVPMGLALGAGLDNVAYLAIGLPLGMLLGLIIGSTLDKRAKDKGQQLDLTVTA